MGRRGGNLSLNQNRKKKKKLVSDDSDEDYVLNENENDEDEEEESNDLKGFLESSNDEQEDEDSWNYGAVIVSSDEEKKKKRKIVRSSSKDSKTRFADEEDELERKETRVRRLVKRNKISDDDDDFCDEEDKDDEEFNPDEIDWVDEEEELKVETRSRVSRKYVSHEKRSSKRKSKVVIKNSIRKKRKKVVVERSLGTDDDDDDDFDVDFRSVRRSKKKSKRRRNTSIVEDSDSDQDGAGLEPSDCEYTISDEEKELLREANNFVGSSSTSSLSKRRLRVHGDSRCQQLRPVEVKGKEMVTNQEDTGKQVCGICFSEEGQGIVRGILNCCNHYFCFACIMEWSKIESRCPLCKLRFATIRKQTSSNLGIHLRNLVVDVPMRDQVYQPTEEEVRGYFDPYDGVVCIECHLGGDDSLMLLCDICDSPAHTYCVGLGREVPEGNWYCQVCRISISGPSDVQVQDLSQGTHTSGLPYYVSPQRSNVEHSDATPHLSVATSDPTLRHEYGVFPSPRYPVGDDVHLPSPTGLGVSTLSDRRTIHRQIRNLLSNNIMSQRTEMATRTDDGNVGSEVIADSDDEQINNSITQRA